jgi:hypothetical protein
MDVIMEAEIKVLHKKIHKMAEILEREVIAPVYAKYLTKRITIRENELRKTANERKHRFEK